MPEKLALVLAPGTDVYTNLAMERCLTEAVSPGTCILFLWQNRGTVVIGRNQNVWNECSVSRLERDGISLARRMSGGGAVYHDLGNLNFTFCACAEESDPDRQRTVIVRACELAGAEASVSGRNDILVDGKKVSGHSFYRHEGKAFHNGTLLVSSDLDRLASYLTPPVWKWRGASVSSVRSRVANLNATVPGLTPEAMREAVIRAFESVYGLPAGRKEIHLDEKQIAEYRKWFASREWVFGNRTPYTAETEGKYPWGGIRVELLVKGGSIEDANVDTDAMDYDIATALKKALKGVPLRGDMLRNRILSEPGLRDVSEDLCGMLADIGEALQDGEAERESET